MSTSPAFTRRTFLGGATASAALFALAACATPAPPGAEEGSATEVDTINFYGNSLGEDAQKGAWESVIKAWEAASGASVKPVIYPYDQAATQLALTGSAGRLMGVGQSGGWQVLLPLGLLADLSDVAEGLAIPSSALDTYRIDGKLYVLPVNAAGIGMVVNGEIAKSVGLKSGLSIDDFSGVLEKIKQQDSSLIPYAAVTKNPDLKDAVHWMWGFGSPVVTDDLEVTIGDKESVDAMEWYKGLQDAGLIQAGVARGDARILFASGRTALYDDAPLASTFVKTNGAAQNIIDNISAIARPQYKGLDSYNRDWGSGLFATAGEGETTSKDFIRFLSTDVAAGTALYEQSAIAPANADVTAEIPALAKDKFQTAFRTEVAEHARGAAWIRTSVSAQVDTTISEGVAGILAGQTDVQSGLNALRDSVQKLLDDNA